ncbi:PRD domain-containing protein [Enterococcus casseliflavus]|uniref:PRD domain-containing protein n=3 Tax=Enterococcus TaxID=1350 RepID=A0A415EQB6_ENTCA|nr:PRD domain-containing protein [Enterococcus casseliflavus]MUN95207.1 PRD domain-containing protein [Enterococcus casseliflavus]RHK05543.1 PRD domain-containing protein [Enterococcus casseliflavus]
MLGVYIFVGFFVCLKGGEKMKPITIYNNNAVLVEDNGTECVVIGNGVGFGVKGSGVIDQRKIDKKYVLDAEFTQNKFGSLMAGMDERHVILTAKIIEEAEKDLARTFDSSIYLFLGDHINYAIERNLKGEAITNDLMWEIKKYYPREFAAAKRSLQFIERSEKIRFIEDEAGFIALHFVNASSSSRFKNETIFTTKVIAEIVQIVEYDYGMKLDETSMNYDRFLTHIRYFVSRIFSESKEVKDEADLLQHVKQLYPKAYQTGLKIKKHIAGQYKVKITDSELLYFVIHINRVTTRELD